MKKLSVSVNDKVSEKRMTARNQKDIKHGGQNVCTFDKVFELAEVRMSDCVSQQRSPLLMIAVQFRLLEAVKD